MNIYILLPLQRNAQQKPKPIPDAWMYGYPQYHMGLTYTYFSLFHEGFASGTVVLPRGVLTAGHVLFLNDTQSWATEGRFMRWNHGSTGWPFYNPEK